MDYLEAFTGQAKVQNKLCGQWRIGGGERLTSHGPKQTLVGYCYDDRSGHSCESATITLNVVVNSSPDLSQRYGAALPPPKGFTVVVTGYRHPGSAKSSKELLLEAEEAEDEASHHQRQTPVVVDDAGGPCLQDEFLCPILDFSVHDGKPHCVWDHLRCDGHQNCGFTLNEDESGCPAAGGVDVWSVSTMTLLVAAYLGVVLVLVLITMVLLR